MMANDCFQAHKLNVFHYNVALLFLCAFQKFYGSADIWMIRFFHEFVFIFNLF